MRSESAAEIGVLIYGLVDAERAFPWADGALDRDFAPTVIATFDIWADLGMRNTHLDPSSFRVPRMVRDR